MKIIHKINSVYNNKYNTGHSKEDVIIALREWVEQTEWSEELPAELGDPWRGNKGCTKGPTVRRNQ